MEKKPKYREKKIRGFPLDNFLYIKNYSKNSFLSFLIYLAPQPTEM